MSTNADGANDITGAPARILRHARRSANLTQRALASASGVPQATISRIESSEEIPRYRTMERLLRSLGLVLEAVPLGRPQITSEKRLALESFGGMEPWVWALKENRGSTLPTDILNALIAEVPFVLVGQFAARLYGAPTGATELFVIVQPQAAGAILKLISYYQLSLVGEGTVSVIRHRKTWRVDLRGARGGILTVRCDKEHYERLRRNANALDLMQAKCLVACVDDLIVTDGHGEGAHPKDIPLLRLLRDRADHQNPPGPSDKASAAGV